VDALQAVGDPELRAALLFARRSERAVTADELAEHAHVHRNVARSRLERLVDAGVLQSSYERRSGRNGPGAGRPAKTYAVVPSLEAVEFPAGHWTTLLEAIVDALPEGELHAVGERYGARLAAEAGLRASKAPARAFEGVCSAVRRLGYQATLEEADSDGAVIATPTCPLRPLVRARPSAAELDRGMWAGLARSALDEDGEVSVECETRDCLLDHASCRVIISLRRRV
jgi:predicted ArsR family transcriptional regulator